MKLCPEEKWKTFSAATQQNTLTVPTTVIIFNSKERSIHQIMKGENQGNRSL